MLKNIFIKSGILLIVAGLSIISFQNISLFINDYNNDIDNSKKIVTTITEDYKSFNVIANKCKEDMVVVSSHLDLYYEDFYNQSLLILENIRTVEEDINSSLSLSHSLIDNCKYDLNNQEVESMCTTFSINYKSMINSYVKMIDEYNEVVSLYNKYAVENKKEVVSLYLIDNNNEMYKIYNNI